MENTPQKVLENHLRCSIQTLANSLHMLLDTCFSIRAPLIIIAISIISSSIETQELFENAAVIADKQL